VRSNQENSATLFLGFNPTKQFLHNSSSTGTDRKPKRKGQRKEMQKKRQAQQEAALHQKAKIIRLECATREPGHQHQGATSAIPSLTLD